MFLISKDCAVVEHVLLSTIVTSYFPIAKFEISGVVSLLFQLYETMPEALITLAVILPLLLPQVAGVTIDYTCSYDKVQRSKTKSINASIRRHITPKIIAAGKQAFKAFTQRNRPRRRS